MDSPGREKLAKDLRETVDDLMSKEKLVSVFVVGIEHDKPTDRAMVSLMSHTLASEDQQDALYRQAAKVAASTLLGHLMYMQRIDTGKTNVTKDLIESLVEGITVQAVMVAERMDEELPKDGPASGTVH